MNRRNNASRPGQPAAQQGIALLEALVGILIFAFGVLGLIGLQAAMTQAQTSGKFRADAANLVSDLFGLIQTDHIDNIGLYADASCASYTRCKDWKAKVAATLPAAEISTTVTPSAGTVAVSLSWRQGQEARSSYASSMNWQQ